ncbi:MAG: hypothetical protein EPN88_08605 [Bacteroidetes bacterium]|nr:MAG: hypothetical protein EPN88_08605 [Bacteroidota bacterium]
MKRLASHILLLLTVTSATSGQDVKVTSAFDSTRIFIGDQIKFSITVDQPVNLKLALPVFKDTICKNIEILSGPFLDSSAIMDGRIKITERYLITSFDSGFYQIHPVYAEIKNESGLKRFYSDYSQLKVMRVTIAPADTISKIYDIIKPYRAPVTFGEILPWILIVAVLCLVIWASVRFIRNLKLSKKGIEPMINPDPAHVIAFRELERLREEQLWQKGEIKYYYTRLTEILRQYLENRYKVYSLEMTTSETLDALVRTGFKKDRSYNQLKNVLNGADLVKFAKYNPEPSENESHFQNSWDFVVATKEEEEVAAVVIDEKEQDKVGEG